MMNTDNTPLMTLREAAQALRVSHATARNWFKDGILSGFQVKGTIRIHRAAVDEMLEAVGEKEQEH